MNHITLMGRLGSDPELRYTQGGHAVANARLATSKTWTDSKGERQEKTEWHTLVLWGKQAENFEKFMHKGKQVLVEGSLEYSEWEDKDGQRRSKAEINVSRFHFIGNSEGGRSDRPRGNDNGGGGAEEKFDQSFNDDDIPF